MTWERLWINVNLATLDCAASAPEPYGAVHDGALAVRGGQIVWVGARKDLPADHAATETIDAAGAWMTPGLIDCHTHLVYAGTRAGEFERRLNGESYEAIARSGGGIRSTVSATRAASEEALMESAGLRLRQLQREGVTTVEIKSGYGLDTENEMKMLRVARALKGSRVHATFLGAHALPEEFEARADDYIELVCEDMLPRVAAAGLASSVDAFCEGIGFSVSQTSRVFERARALGLPVKLHADQMSDLGGAALAARFGALSADHLEWSSEQSVAAMAAAGTIATLLPGAFYFLREARLPPVEALRRHGVPMAISTDSNPGSSPTTSPLLMMNMAATLFRLRPAEALHGFTTAAAQALGAGASVGRLRVGMRADLALWEITHPAELTYAFGSNPNVGREWSGDYLEPEAEI